MKARTMTDMGSKNSQLLVVVHEVVGVAKVDAGLALEKVVVGAQDAGLVGHAGPLFVREGDGDAVLDSLYSSSALSGSTMSAPAPHASKTAQGDGVPLLDLSEV